MSWPLGGLSAAFVASALWVSGVPLRALDWLVAALFVCGAALSSVGYVRGRARRLAVVALGANALGLLGVLLLYGAG